MKFRSEHHTKKKINSHTDSYKNILIGIPELYEQTGGNLEKMIHLLRKFISDQNDDIKKEWERASGETISEKHKQLVFNNPKTLSNLKILNNLIDFINYIEKANKISEFFEVESSGPIAAIKKSRRCYNGGIKRAEAINKERPLLKNKYQDSFDQIKKRSPGLSNNAIHIKIAEKFICSPSKVYKILTDYSSLKN